MPYTEIKSRQHPEKHNDEIFLGNTSSRTQMLRESCYKTLRFGEVAYATNGARLHGFVPMFVKCSEFLKVQEGFKINRTVHH